LSEPQFVEFTELLEFLMLSFFSAQKILFICHSEHSEESSKLNSKRPWLLKKILRYAQDDNLVFYDLFQPYHYTKKLFKNDKNLSLRGTKQSRTVHFRSVKYAIASFLAMTKYYL
jgi:hypothetical protein